MKKRAGRKFGQKAKKTIEIRYVRTNVNHFDEFCKLYGADITQLLF
jgi:hypothetical protein